MEKSPLSPFDQKRAAEKQASRDADAHAIASGAKSAAQLNRENGFGAVVKKHFKMGMPKKLF